MGRRGRGAEEEEVTSRDVLDLLAHLLDQHLELHRLAVEILHQRAGLTLPVDGEP